MFVEKMNTGMDFYKDSVTATQISLPALNTAADKTPDFAKALDKNTTDRFENEFTGNTGSRYDNMLNSKEEVVRQVDTGVRNNDPDWKKESVSYEESNRKTNKEVEENKSNKENKLTEREKNSSTGEKTGNNDTETKEKSNNSSNTSNSSNTTKSSETYTVEKKAGETTPTVKTQQIKELIEKARLQHEELGKIKVDIKESFSEAKSIASNDQMEKVVLKNLEDQGKTAKNKASENVKKDSHEGNSNNSGSNDSRVEQKHSQETGVEKSDNKTVITNDFKVHKKEADQENPAHLLNSQTKDAQSVSSANAKLKDIQARQNIPEQYQVLKDKITSSVENSIKMLIANNESQVSIKLNPPELGRVQIELSIKDNSVHARVNTENTAVREVILSNMDQLKSNLENAGVHVTQIDVEVGGFKNQFDKQFGQENTGNGTGGTGSGNGGNLASGEASEEISSDKVRNQRPVSFYLGQSINVVI
jgi:flagellar hook-length control protein FliK